MSRNSPQLAHLIRQLAPLLRHRSSPRLLAALAVCAIVYLSAVPWLNRSLSWSLPGWRELAGASQAASKGPSGSPTASSAQRTEDAAAKAPRASSQSPSPSDASHRDAPRRDASQPEASDLGVDPRLSEIVSGASRAVYESPGGLRYTRGSQHGHRLNHVLAHTRDEVDRPGSHGVFDSRSPAEVIGLIDEAYALAQRGEQTQTSHEGDRIIFTVHLRRRVGYVGGEAGRRSGNPAAQRLRLVVDGRDLITAFPLR